METIALFVAAAIIFFLADRAVCALERIAFALEATQPKDTDHE